MKWETRSEVSRACWEVQPKIRKAKPDTVSTAKTVKAVLDFA
jgi:hypothetical protein